MADPLRENVSRSAVSCTIAADGKVIVDNGESAVQWPDIESVKQRIRDGLGAEFLELLVLADYVRAFGGDYTPRTISVRKRADLRLSARSITLSDEVV